MIGEPIGQGKGFAFSDALSKKGGTWNWDNLSQWLTSPKAFAPGTKMTFAGLSNPQDRADVDRLPQLAQRCAQAAAGSAGLPLTRGREAGRPGPTMVLRRPRRSRPEAARMPAAAAAARLQEALS